MVEAGARAQLHGPTRYADAFDLFHSLTQGGPQHRHELQQRFRDLPEELAEVFTAADDRVLTAATVMADIHFEQGREHVADGRPRAAIASLEAAESYQSLAVRAHQARGEDTGSARDRLGAIDRARREAMKAQTSAARNPGTGADAAIPLGSAPMFQPKGPGRGSAARPGPSERASGLTSGSAAKRRRETDGTDRRTGRSPQ
ncbi:MAG: hypothetical protein M0026_21790 [Nocardiopsaceae bacterium]|nr:hypothetical protein [Nocardiopsaceae bacterium]